MCIKIFGPIFYIEPDCVYNDLIPVLEYIIKKKVFV